MVKFFSKKKEKREEEKDVFILYDSQEEVNKETQQPEEAITTLYNIPVSPEALKGRGRIIAVQGASGGDGTSTVAANIAAYYAFINPEKVVLIDVDGYGSIRGRMGIQTNECLNSILDWEDIFSLKDIHRGLLAHSSGVMLVPGVLHYDQEEQVTPGIVLKMLTLLKQEFEFIIVDCPSVSSANNTWAVALVADLVVNVFSPDRTSLDFLHEINGYLLRLGCLNRTVTVLNKAGIPGGIRPSDIEKYAGLKINGMLPYSIAVAEANNRRQLLVYTNQRDEFSKAIQSFSEEIPDIISALKGEGVENNGQGIN